MINLLLFAVSAALLLLAAFGDLRDGRPLAWTIGGLLLAVGIIAHVTRFNGRKLTRAALRLDIFLPWLRHRRDCAPFALPAWLVWIKRLFLPRPLGSDFERKKPGWLRRLLKWIGPTWYSAPARRMIQAVCFVAFLWLFFYVAWPYSARPAPPGASWPGWRPGVVDETGQLTAISTAQLATPISTDAVLFAHNDSARDPSDRAVGAFRVISAGPSKLVLEPEKPVTADDLQLLAASPGPWTLRGSGGALREWRPEFDAENSRLVVAGSTTHAEMCAPGAAVEVLDEAVVNPAEQSLGQFRIKTVLETRLVLTPPGHEAAAAELTKLVARHPGPWTMYEKDPDAWPSHYADDLDAKERIAAETFLIIDPLVAISTALAARAWVWSLVFAGVILLVGLIVPRGFCGYLCPLGTLIDLFDWAIGKRVTRFRVSGDGWWVHIKYYVLLGTIIAAAGGVLLTGFVSAIPVITRGFMYLIGPLQTGLTRGWHNVPAPHWGHLISIVLFFAVLGLGLLRPRFWCKYVCPSGAVFSVGNLFRFTERKVESTCIHCNKCVEICPFDAIKPDFTTRVTDCTLCQTCGGVCPTHAIKFVERWNLVELKVENDPPTGETRLGRRGFLAAGIGTAAAVTGGLVAAAGTKAWGANVDDPQALRPIRPPGSVPEREFLQLCIRCGECFKACPNDVLQVLGFQQGFEGLWTPHAVPDFAGCESSCNACGQVCPTGAIRALPLEEKKVCRMGLAIVNEQTCLPFAGREACQLCVDECHAAGYHAIEFVQVRTEVDDQTGQPIEGTGFAAPRVLADKCVGCGLCQTRCYGINVKEKGLLTESAIIIEAGEGKEDRLMTGSYIALREAEQRHHAEQRRKLELEREHR
jgi:ferredoxin